MKAELFTSIDELGILQAQIADLTKRADAIKDALKDEASLSGQKSFEGKIFKAAYIETNRSSVDYKALIADLGISAEKLGQYTKTTAVYSVRVSSL